MAGLGTTSAFLKLRRLLSGAALTGLCSLALAQDDAGDEEAPWLNAFDQIRSEQLIAQGQAAMRSNEFETAERIFLDAVQIVKINFGLDAPQQRTALQHAIEAQLAQGKWEELENHFSYFEWLNDEIYPQDFYDYLRGTQQLSRMLLKASADTDNPLSVRYLLAAKNLNWRAVSGIEATLGEDHVQLAPWLYNIVLTHYYQTSLIKTYGVDSYVFKDESEEEISGWTLGIGDSLRISYRIGKELLERIVAIYQQADDVPPESPGLMQVYLADWELLFGNETEAIALYSSAFEQLMSAGLTTEQANSVFSRPLVLPDTTLHTTLASLTESRPDGRLRFKAWTPNYPATALPSEQLALNSPANSEFTALLRFDLLPMLPEGLSNNNRTIRFGFNIRDLEVVSTTPDNDLVQKQARYEVSLLQFRPKLENGTAVVSEDMELEYSFAPQRSNLSVSGN